MSDLTGKTVLMRTGTYFHKNRALKVGTVIRKVNSKIKGLYLVKFGTNKNLTTISEKHLIEITPTNKGTKNAK